MKIKLYESKQILSQSGGSLLLLFLSQKLGRDQYMSWEESKCYIG